MTLKLLTAAAVLTTAIASPASAMGPHARSEAVQLQQQRAQAQQRAEVQRHEAQRHNEFWPGDVAAGMVGSAIGAAGAIATAPFRHDGYAYNGYYGPYGYSSGFVCQPGTTFIGEDGLRHICQ